MEKLKLLEALKRRQDEEHQTNKKKLLLEMERMERWIKNHPKSLEQELDL